MAKPLTIELKPEQRRELEQVRDHHEKPYMRERTAAILKIAAGQSGRQVALHGLLKRRDPDTVYSWVHGYQAEGLAGLMIKPGRGRKPAFSPSAGNGRGCPRSDTACHPTHTESVRLQPESLEPGTSTADV